MKKSIIIYNSKTGTTKLLGENIQRYLSEQNINSKIFSIDELNEVGLQDIDYVFLGCWTSGLLLIMQKPEKKWVEFAQQLPTFNENKLVFFTTYKVRTGSMFRNMSKYIKFIGSKQIPEIKSKNGQLLYKYQKTLDNFIKV